MVGKRIIRVAVIGCGRIAGHHCNSIEKIDGFELAAVCDLDGIKAHQYGLQYDVPAFTNYHKMLKSHADIDVVAIMTPSGMHFEHSMDVMKRYQKNIIVEKPTFLRLDHLDSAYETACSLGLQIFPVFQNRHNLAVERVRQAIVLNELGKIQVVSVRVRWCRPQRYYDLAPWRGTLSHDGGALTNQGIHHVDLLRYLAGEVDFVSTTMRTLGVEVEVEDTAVANYEFKSGAVGSLEVTTAARPDNFEASISIVGSRGMAQIGGIAVNELQVFTPQPAACKPNSEDFSGCVYGSGHEKIYASVYESICFQKPFTVTASDCRHTIELLHAFYRSAEDRIGVSVGKGLSSRQLGRDNKEISELYRTSSCQSQAKVEMASV